MAHKRPPDAPLDIEELQLATMTLDDVGVREIARQLDRPYTTVRAILNRPHVRGYIDAVRTDAMEEVQRMKVRGARVGMLALIKLAESDTTPAGARATAAGKLVEVCVGREPLRLVHTGDPTEPIHVQHAGQVLQGLSDGDLDAMIDRLTVDDSTDAR